MAMVPLALKSLRNRKTTVLLTVLSIAISVSLLLGVERIRTQAKASFANTISGTDLIVGARTGSVQLLLYSVFRIGNATNNFSWESYQDIANARTVDWTVPFSLGDSHRGYRVLGTTQDYFTYYRYGRKQSLQFNAGQQFDGLFDAVIGAEVARKLNYQVGDKITLAHGAGSVSFVKHDDLPFTVVGILEPTSTPVDRTVHVSLEAIEAIHVGWEQGMPQRGQTLNAEELLKAELQPKVITAALVGMNSRIQTFQMQRMINQYPKEPLMAILPGVALHELWGMLSVLEQALVVIAFFVVGSGLLGMLIMILSSLSERRREMAILRAVGAKPRHIFMLMMSESVILAMLGAITGVIFLYALMAIAQPIVQSMYGIQIDLTPLTPYELTLLGIVVVSGLVIGIAPSLRAYRNSLVDGMTIRV